MGLFYDRITITSNEIFLEKLFAALGLINKDYTK